MIDEYPLSPEQAEAVLVMYHDLGYAVWGIVAAFREEGYPITKAQVMEIIRNKPVFDPVSGLKSIYAQVVDMIIGSTEQQWQYSHSC